MWRTRHEWRLSWWVKYVRQQSDPGNHYSGTEMWCTHMCKPKFSRPGCSMCWPLLFWISSSFVQVSGSTAMSYRALECALWLQFEALKFHHSRPVQVTQEMSTQGIHCLTNISTQMVSIEHEMCTRNTVKVNWSLEIQNYCNCPGAICKCLELRNGFSNANTKFCLLQVYFNGWPCNPCFPQLYPWKMDLREI